MDMPRKKSLVPAPPVKFDDPEIYEHLGRVRRKDRQRERRMAEIASKKKRLTLKTADRHDLYQRSVQSPESDVEFMARVYKKRHGNSPAHLREDFCGTAYIAKTWIGQGKAFTAEGFDLDPEVLAWGIEHNFTPLGDNAARCRLHRADVRSPSARAPDVRSAQNFSWFVFKTRPELLEYFKSAYEDLAPGGIFYLDIQGGPESMEEMEEETDHGEFVYVWDQDKYWPATGEYETRIHYRFRDGTVLKNAFRYDWRLWGLPEAVDALRDAGFSEVESHWEGTESDGETGNGIYRKSRRGENCQAWVTYIVAYK